MATKNKNAIDADICIGIEELDRGEGIPDDQVKAYLADLKAKSK